MESVYSFAASLAALLFLSTVQAAQPSAPSPVPAPLRQLQWGQLNFLHTTDTHGWHAGHLQEPSYSADWGDYISFAHHMRRLADAEGFDLLLVDTGDRIEGNGLYDASDPKGKYTFDIFKHQDIDLICSGNHELYKASSSENERDYTVPNFKDNYLASNLDIVNPQTGELEPLAPRVRKFTTKNQGIRITAFGFIFNFQGNANNTHVRPVQDAIKEQWFQDAIRDRTTDLFLVIGHVAADAEEYRMIFNAIRGQQWDVPIQFFAGHSHIRDFKKYDAKATVLESGRYMETIGFLSIDGVNTGSKKDVSTTNAGLKVRRKYIDNNPFSLHRHSQTNETTFPTELGLNVSAQIASARETLGLDRARGCAPKDLWIDRVDVASEDSLFNWLGNQVLPDALHESNETRPKIMLTNTGAMRFDIFRGPFTVDSEYLVSPFTSGFRKIQNVNCKLAQKLLGVLNNEAQIMADIEPKLRPGRLLAPEQVSRKAHSLAVHADKSLVSRQEQKILDGEPQLFSGYTTKDDAGDDGDDTLHLPIPFSRVPNCIQSEIDFPQDASEPEQVDVVYNAFIEPWVVLALQFLGADYKQSDSVPTADGRSMTKVITTWVEQNWPCEG